MLDRPIDTVPLAVVDVETTGLFAETGDRVCEVAVLRAEPCAEPLLYCRLVNPGRPIDPEAASVNGIRDADLADAPAFGTIVPELTAMLADAVLVAHNAAFDISFLSAEYAVARAELPDVPVLDTLLLARRRFRFGHNSLGAVAASLGVPLDRQHRAGGDVVATYAVFRRMVEALAPRGLRTVRDYIAAQGQEVPLRASPPRDVPEPIGAAIDRRQPLTICYVDAAGRSSERTVDPLWVNDQYLIAYCRLCRGQRTFRLDRIVDAWLP